MDNVDDELSAGQEVKASGVRRRTLRAWASPRAEGGASCDAMRGLVWSEYPLTAIGQRIFRL